MEFFFAVFFLLFYYVRPQDWVPGLIGLSLVKPIMVTWFGVLMVNRSLDSPLPGILKTPHDWIILSYMMYVVSTAPDSMTALKGFISLVAFYALTVQSLTSWPRLQSYLKWWTLALVTLSIFGVLIPYGIDVTGGKETVEQFFGRLCLGTWLHDNPNSLGHSVIVAIPTGYLLFFWRGSTLGKYIVFPAIAGLAYWCVYQTQSKGAFLVGAILVASIFVVGRPKSVQLVVITIALTAGVSALNFLPRMSQMSDLRADEGVQGRLLAWEMARGVSKTHSTGLGWQQFSALIDWKEGNTIIYDIPKATHSSYVQVGADLGRYGLFLYLAGLWCVIHTLLKFKPSNETEDRCRRILWVLLLSTLISGWMINRQYHTEYFLLLAATAALHRLGKARELELVSISRTKSSESETPGSQAVGEMMGTAPAKKTVSETPAFTTKADDEDAPVKPLWNRFGLLDVVACIGMTWVAFWLWDYILENI